jgi:cephalosporin-C deacetylase-like acetyl esterase
MKAVPPKVITRVKDMVRARLGCAMDTMVENFYQAEGRRLVLERESQRRRVRTVEAWKSERLRVRGALLKAFGGLPERRLRLTECGEVKKERYVLHRLLFSPFEGHWVSANLYVPRDGDGPFSAIILPPGHTQHGKVGVSDRAVFFAINGFVVLTFDYFGSGERRVLLKDGRPLAFPGAHHNLLGMRMFSEGYNLQWFMIAETMGAVDVLERVPEVDASRIGITGSSGGGTESFYTCALDERIKAAAPAASVHSYRYRLYADDAEQSFYDAVRQGIDYTDVASFLVAPRPLFIIANQRDIWDIEGTRDVFSEARRYYRLHGAEHLLRMRVWDKGHVYDQDQLRVVARWFQKQIGEGKGGGALKEVGKSELPSERECQVTSHGNLYREGLRKPNLVFQGCLKRRTSTSRRPPDLFAAIRSFVGQRIEWREVDSYCVNGCAGQRILFAPEKGLLLPAEILTPSKPRGTMILLDEAGRMDDLEWQLKTTRKGYATMRPDLRGWGETAPAEDWSDRENWTQIVYAGKRIKLATFMWLVGKQAPIERAKDVVGLLNVVAEMGLPRPWIVHGKRSGALVGLCAGFVDRRVDRLILEDFPSSYREALKDETRLLRADNLLFGLGRFGIDLPDLCRRFRPRRISFLGGAC